MVNKVKVIDFLNIEDDAVVPETQHIRKQESETGENHNESLEELVTSSDVIDDVAVQTDFD
jgi:histidyl-tRNA synthetase